MIKPRAFNTITVQDGSIIKTSTDSKALYNECNWYSSIPSSLHTFIPHILDCNGTSIRMDYVNGKTLHESFVSGEYGIGKWDEILAQIQSFSEAMREYQIQGDFYKSLKEMYYNKTKNRLELLREHPCFSRFFKESPIINGIEYPSIPELLDNLESEVRVLYQCDTFNIIHGDLHFGNIILNDRDEIKAIDPRGNFGEYTIYGDGRYDLAKLYHSIEGGYDYIIDDMYHLEAEDNCIDYTIEPSEYGFDLLSRVRNVMAIKEEKEIRLIESLLFLSMVPLHFEDASHQTVMFARGLELYKRVVG